MNRICLRKPDAAADYPLRGAGAARDGHVRDALEQYDLRPDDQQDRAPPSGPQSLRVRADIIGHARINMYVNISHACFEMAD